LLRDKLMAFRDGDIADFAHLAAIPYTDLVTVDRRIADILGKVFRKLGQRESKADLSARVFTKLSDMLAAVG